MAKIGYIRVSTDKQVVDRQFDLLHICCDQVFIEKGVSAVAKKRPVYDEVMATLVEGDVFVVSSLDRAFRSVQDALNELENLKNEGLRFSPYHKILIPIPPKENSSIPSPQHWPHGNAKS